MGQNLAIHESRLRWLGRGEDNIEFTGQHLSSIRVNDLSILAMSFAMSVFTWDGGVIPKGRGGGGEFQL